jgi:hypothetical protein
MEPPEKVLSIGFCGSYRRQCIREFEGEREQYEISPRFFVEIGQTNVVQKEFNV